MAVYFEQSIKEKGQNKNSKKVNIFLNLFGN